MEHDVPTIRAYNFNSKICFHMVGEILTNVAPAFWSWIPVNAIGDPPSSIRMYLSTKAAGTSNKVVKNHCPPLAPFSMLIGHGSGVTGTPSVSLKNRT